MRIRQTPVLAMVMAGTMLLAGCADVLKLVGAAPDDGGASLETTGSIVAATAAMSAAPAPQAPVAFYAPVGIAY